MLGWERCLHTFQTIMLLFSSRIFYFLPAGVGFRERSPGCFFGISHMVCSCEELEEAATALKMLVCQALSALMSGLWCEDAGLGPQDKHNSCYFTTSAAASAAAAVFKIVKAFTSASCSFMCRAAQPTQTRSEPNETPACGARQRCAPVGRPATNAGWDSRIATSLWNGMPLHKPPSNTPRSLISEVISEIASATQNVNGQTRSYFCWNTRLRVGEHLAGINATQQHVMAH